ncbi:unnamed protein product [Cylicocyclus nassatus]|uniref:Uncharacterized protein n=1 Tax=Cylicocyclus nassatus TaxID=53992 RepID=A0AA36DN09_CYLNA|nr:unnamed protein product [Cylicocyclus nassatus]
MVVTMEDQVPVSGAEVGALDASGEETAAVGNSVKGEEALSGEGRAKAGEHSKEEAAGALEGAAPGMNSAGAKGADGEEGPRADGEEAVSPKKQPAEGDGADEVPPEDDGYDYDYNEAVPKWLENTLKLTSDVEDTMGFRLEPRKLLRDEEHYKAMVKASIETQEVREHFNRGEKYVNSKAKARVDLDSVKTEVVIMECFFNSTKMTNEQFLGRCAPCLNQVSC